MFKNLLYEYVLQLWTQINGKPTNLFQTSFYSNNIFVQKTCKINRHFTVGNEFLSLIIKDGKCLKVVSEVQISTVIIYICNRVWTFSSQKIKFLNLWYYVKFLSALIITCSSRCSYYNKMIIWYITTSLIFYRRKRTCIYQYLHITCGTARFLHVLFILCTIYNNVTELDQIFFK